MRQLVVVFEKTRDFVDNIYEKLLELEKNGDVAGVFFSDLQLDDIILPLFRKTFVSINGGKPPYNPFE